MYRTQNYPVNPAQWEETKRAFWLWLAGLGRSI
jgi:hypothetical protein